MKNKNVHLNWLGSYEVSELNTFFEKYRDSGGIYIWVFKGNPERIYYVGETSNFENRIYTHFSNAIHGLYTAVDCPVTDDLLNIYSSVVNKKCSDDVIFAPKKVDLQNLNEQVRLIKHGIDLNLHLMSNMRFIFAEIDNADSSLRKEVESIFMQKLKNAYEAINGNLHWDGFCRSSTNFWGTITKGIEADAIYSFSSQGKIDKTLKNDLGLTENWSYGNGF